jgi:hypothetical protein
MRLMRMLARSATRPAEGAAQGVGSLRLPIAWTASTDDLLDAQIVTSEVPAHGEHHCRTQSPPGGTVPSGRDFLT